MNDQAQRLRDLLNQKKNVKEARTIAVLSGKGGVGKSNFALNFGIGLAKHQKKVILFDLDFGMGNIDVLMGLAPKKTIVNMFNESLSLSEIIETGPYSLSYVAAGSGLSDLFEMNDLHFEYFVNQLREVAYQYDYIIFDLGAGLQRQHVHFALAAHECVVVTTTEPTSITDAYSVLKHLYSERENISLQLLVNRAVSEKEGKQTLQRLTKVVKQFLSKDINSLGFVYDDRSVIDAVKEQTPFLLKNEKSLASRSLTAIIDSYLEPTSTEMNRPSHSFVTKLKMLFSRKVE
ncbi:MinD/ParA family protein [Salirhabdus sp. Marseille-P4669]|uniref:MinD/ParA family protein n=1 Tax=Salirhabdus sp. Marseille-P4669 TaxID=2042310 RepID=UPI000C7B86D6|nr:MinD/ParA family protein [Salirhabdus sp. Marseille-P4669]